MRRDTEIIIEFIHNLLHIYGDLDQEEILDEVIDELTEWKDAIEESEAKDGD